MPAAFGKASGHEALFSEVLGDGGIEPVEFAGRLKCARKIKSFSGLFGGGPVFGGMCIRF